MSNEHELDFAIAQLPAEMVDLGGVATLDKIATAFATANAIAEASHTGNSTNDDILISLFRFVKQLPEDQQITLRFMFLRDVYRILKAEKMIDRASFEKTIKTGMIIRCQSLQAAVGNGGDQSNRSLSSKLAWTALNIRHVAVTYMIALIPNARAAALNGLNGQPAAPPEPDINRIEVIQYLRNLTAWFLKLTDHLVSMLFVLNRDLDVTQKFDANALRLRIAAMNDPSLAVLCCHYTRLLIRHTGQVLRMKLAPYTNKAAWVQPPSPTAAHWVSFSRVLKATVIAPPVLETILSEFEDRILRVYSANGLAEAQRQEIELEILVRGEVPEIMLDATGPVAWLIGTAVERLRGGTVAIGGVQTPVSDRAEANLAFADWNVLGLGDDKSSRHWRRTVLYDGVQKRVLGERASALDVGAGSNTLRVRSCTRCGTSMEDVVHGSAKGARNHPVFGNMRLCICNGHWVTEDPLQLKIRD